MFAGCGMVGGHNHFLSVPNVKPQQGLEEYTAFLGENSANPGTFPVNQGQMYANAVTQPPLLTNVSNPLKLVPQPVLPQTPKIGQEGFRKVCRTEEDSPSPFPGLPPGVLEMRVKEGSKIRNLMGFAMARMHGATEGNRGGVSTVGLRQVVFTGSGRAVTKTITCAEIMKRKVGCLHQLTKLRYKVMKEVWERADGGKSEMTLHRTVPSISILLSKDPLNPKEPGYQPPEAVSALWQGTGAQTAQMACKRPLGPLPYSTFSHCKRLCLGEGVPVLPPH